MDQTAPPLFLWGERAILLLLGHSDCALRLLPVVAGTVAAALMYPLARRFLDAGRGPAGRDDRHLLPAAHHLLEHGEAVLGRAAGGAFCCCSCWSGRLPGVSAARAAPTLVAAGAVAPWLSLTSVFVLGGVLGGSWRWRRRGARAPRGRALAATSAVLGPLGADRVPRGVSGRRRESVYAAVLGAGLPHARPPGVPRAPVEVPRGPGLGLRRGRSPGGPPAVPARSCTW